MPNELSEQASGMLWGIVELYGKRAVIKAVRSVEPLDPAPDDDRPPCAQCGGSGLRATARTADGSELARHERAGTPCERCDGSGVAPPLRKEEVLANLEPAGPDHTSGTMRCQWRLVGAHIHCRVFGPFSGKAGDLVFRAGSEWEHFRRTHPNWSFREEEASHA